MTEEIQLIPAGGSATQRLKAGQHIKVINTAGTQVVDCWAFTLADPNEFMSMEHTRVEIARVSPRVGDQLYTNRRRPVLTMVQDTSPGVHDTTLAACDVYRYERLGARGYHRNCTDNLAQALRAAGLNVGGYAVPAEPLGERPRPAGRHAGHRASGVGSWRLRRAARRARPAHGLVRVPAGHGAHQRR